MNRIALIALFLSVSLGGSGTAQAPGDSAHPADSSARSRGYSDSASHVAADTGRRQTVDSAKTDSAKARAATVDSTRSAVAQPSVDSSLVTACQSGPAAGVLLVVFTSDATRADKSRAAKAIDGKVAGSAPTGEDYVVVPDTISLRAAADVLIQQRGVSQISERTCS